MVRTLYDERMEVEKRFAEALAARDEFVESDAHTIAMAFGIFHEIVGLFSSLRFPLGLRLDADWEDHAGLERLSRGGDLFYDKLVALLDSQVAGLAELVDSAQVSRAGIARPAEWTQIAAEVPPMPPISGLVSEGIINPEWAAFFETLTRLMVRIDEVMARYPSSRADICALLVFCFFLASLLQQILVLLTFSAWRPVNGAAH
jgi:hypothetical protein